jgi:hypothetical protein
MKKRFHRHLDITKKNLLLKNPSEFNSLDKKSNVDINRLLNRVRVNKKNEIKQKIIFSSIGILLVSFMGIFVSIIK